MKQQLNSKPLSPGYPVILELSAAALVAAQLLLSWLALDRLPSTVVPYFGPGRAVMGLPGAEAEARLWLWMVVGLYAMLLGGSLVMYRAIRSTPIPIVAVGAFAFLAVLRAGAISLNLNPAMSPKQALLRALLAGVVALLLGVAVERFRSRRLLPPLLIGKSDYDERTPRGTAHILVAILGLGVPLLVMPTRVRVTERGVVVVTAVSFFTVPAIVIDRVERAPALQALFGAGINLASTPSAAVRIFRRGRFFPLLISVSDRERFLEVVGGQSL